MTDIVRLEGAAAEAAVPMLADILLDCVQGGASVSFMADLDRATALAFWHGIAKSVAAGERILLAARNDDGRLVGTVQVILSMPPNQPHRGEIAKMLVHRQARKQGLGAALMRTAEAEAKKAGKTLLTLDTVSDADGFHLYRRLGWEIAGEIPGYALWPDGRPCPTTFLWRRIP